MATEHQNPAQAGSEENSPLLREFQHPSYEEWREAAEKLLKGAPFEKKLVSKTYEGITLQPIYTEQDVEGLPHLDSLPGFAPYLRGTDLLGHKASSWEVSQEIPYPTAEALNEALQHDLKRGQTAINIILDEASQQGLDPDIAPAGSVGKGGASLATLDDLAAALKDIDLETTPIYVQAGASALPLTALLAAFMQREGKNISQLRGGIDSTPLGLLVRQGHLPIDLADVYDAIAAVIRWLNDQAPNLTAICIQSVPYHHSGANAVQELAFALASGVEYLREMQARGLDANVVAPRMRFEFAIGSDYFMEIAKFRAARLLWAKVVKAFDGDEQAQKMKLHGRTALWNKTVHDPYVNMLRTTVEAFAGAVGGCNSMHVGCFDEVVRPPDAFSRRIARNAQLILREEAHLDEVIDPAGGSWYVEHLTDQVARKAWTLFQEVEQQGGIVKALHAQFPQQQVAETAKARVAHLATRKDGLIGTNMYPNLSEKLLEPRDADESLATTRAAAVKSYRETNKATLPADKIKAPDTMMTAAIEAAASGATLGMLAQATGFGASSLTVEPLRPHRGAEMFERLRAATEAYAQETGNRPRIFMANMGPIPQHKARADFSVGFFQVGGFEMLQNDGFATVDEAARAALDSGAPAVIICSTDATYPDIVPNLTTQLKTANPEMTVILAGYPKEHVENFKAAGVDEFIHLRANVYDILVNLMQKSGILPQDA